MSSPSPTAFAAVRPAWHSLFALSDDTMWNALVMLAVFALTVAGVLVWAIFIRKSGRRTHRHHHRSPGWAQPPEGESPARRRHRRRVRSAELPLNPTRAQTGGLPPLRPETHEPPPPTA